MQRVSTLTLLSVGLVALLGCGGGSTTPPDGPHRPQLAGGGRGSSGDQSNGGKADSGPTNPGFEPAPGFIPLFYAEVNCADSAGTGIITNQTDFQTWWTAAVSCLDFKREGMRVDAPPPLDPQGGNGTVESEDGETDPGIPWDPYGEDAPEVDFSDYAIVTISLDETAAYSSGLWVQDVATIDGTTTVTYEVSSPGDDCAVPAIYLENYGPTIAALIPNPGETTWAFERLDTTWNCTWEPDPNQPWTLYYTDANCDLGPNEALITDANTWQAWLDSAYDCDVARWNDPGFPDSPPMTGGGGSSSPGFPGEEPPGSDPGTDRPFGDPDVDPAPPPVGSWGGDVDFSTHSILILRANTQTRWGGGIWLNDITATDGGTTLEYSVMTPTGNCPQSDYGAMRPTVAIRILKPALPITYIRHNDPVSCDWDDYGDDGVVPPEPRPL